MSILQDICRCGCGKLVNEAECIICNKKFFPYHSSKGLYCSNKCSSKSRLGENNPAWNGGKLNRYCKHCNKEFFIYPSELKKNKNAGQFCSKSCRASYQNKERLDNNSHNFSNNKYNLGKQLSKESKEKLSSVMKYRYNGNKNPFFNKKHSDDDILKMKQARRKLFENGFKHFEVNCIHKTQDGKMLRSSKEIDVYNWLLNNNLPFEVEPIIEQTAMLADFKCNDFYIEVWSHKWRINDERNKNKINYYRQNNIKFINVFPPDLSPLEILLNDHAPTSE